MAQDDMARKGDQGDSLREFLGFSGEGAPRDPMVAARETMRPDMPKRFYTQVSLEPREGGHALALDGRLAKTPARNLLMLAQRPLAEALAAEWAAQGERIDPAAMPLTRLANVALDCVSLATAETQADIVRYAGNDLLFYRADAPERLVERQDALWKPALAWAGQRFSAAFRTGLGIQHVPQDEAALARIAAHVAGIDDPLALAALHVVTTLTGSALLALALAEGAFDAHTIWDAAHVDEDVQVEIWGDDDEALARRAFRRKEYDAAAMVLAALRNA